MLCQMRCTGCSVVRRLSGIGMVGVLVLAGVRLVLSFVPMPGLFCFLRVAPRRKSKPRNTHEPTQLVE